MHHVRQGNQWYFGIQAHVGADAVTGLVHSAAATATNAAGITQVRVFPTTVRGDTGCGAWRSPAARGRCAPS